MRHILTIVLFSALTSIYSMPSNAYVIHNNTGINASFRGGLCPACFSGDIDNGDTAACPGNKNGCESTRVTLYTGYYEALYFGLKPGEVCGIWTPLKVTAHGDVYAYKDRVVVLDDKGAILYDGVWEPLVRPCY